MTATGHALVGAMLAAKFQHPEIALPLCLVSHFVLDMIPHWDAGTHWRKKTKRELFRESAFDVTVSIITSVALYHFILGGSNYLYLFICVFVAQLPDWVMAPYIIFKNKFFMFRHAYNLGRSTNRKLERPWGIVTQIVTVLATYILLFRIF